jgi:hypothetical protein
MTNSGPLYDGTEGRSSKGTKGRLAMDFYAISPKKPFMRFKLFERLEPFLTCVDHRDQARDYIERCLNKLRKPESGKH